MRDVEQWLRARLDARRGTGLRSDVAIALSLGLDPGEGGAFGRPPNTGAGSATRAAAVLVPLVIRGAPQTDDGAAGETDADGKAAPLRGLTVMLTRRTDHLHHHAGQVSFPGGRLEEDDDGPVAAALRETVEETGLPAERVSVLGTLDDYVTITGFRVTPVVGLVRPPFTLAPDPFEVAEVFEVPLPFLLDPANHQTVRRTVNGKPRPYYAMPYQGYYIWGATAGMLMNLYHVLRD